MAEQNTTWQAIASMSRSWRHSPILRRGSCGNCSMLPRQAAATIAHRPTRRVDRHQPGLVAWPRARGRMPAGVGGSWPDGAEQPARVRWWGVAAVRCLDSASHRTCAAGSAVARVPAGAHTPRPRGESDRGYSRRIRPPRPSATPAHQRQHPRRLLCRAPRTPTTVGRVPGTGTSPGAALGGEGWPGRVLCVSGVVSVMTAFLGQGLQEVVRAGRPARRPSRCRRRRIAVAAPTGR